MKTYVAGALFQPPGYKSSKRDAAIRSVTTDGFFFALRSSHAVLVFVL